MRSVLRRCGRSIGTTCLVLAACALSGGCGSTLHFQQLPADQQALSRGTQPGWHALSPWFAVEVKRASWLEGATATFYHLPDPAAPGSRRTLGRQYLYWPSGELVTDKHEFGPRMCAFAVSADGRALLYFTEPGMYMSAPHQDWQPKRFGASLHLYRVGVGDSVVASDVDHWASDARTGIPTDGVIYWVPDKGGHGTRAMWQLGQRVVRSCSEFLPARSSGID